MPRKLTKGKPGVRAKITEDMITEVEKLRGNGVRKQNDLALCLDISPKSFQNYINTGKEYQRCLDEGEKPDEKGEIYFRFMLAFKRGSTKFKEELIQRISEAGKDSSRWQANAWLLERMHQDEFGQNRKSEKEIEAEIQRRVDEIARLGAVLLPAVDLAKIGSKEFVDKKDE